MSSPTPTQCITNIHIGDTFYPTGVGGRCALLFPNFLVRVTYGSVDNTILISTFATDNNGNTTTPIAGITVTYTLLPPVSHIISAVNNGSTTHVGVKTDNQYIVVVQANQTFVFNSAFTTVTIVLEKDTSFSSPVGRPLVPIEPPFTCCDPNIDVTYQLSSLTFDVTEVLYYVRDCRLHKDKLGCYCGSTMSIPSTSPDREIDGTLIQVLCLSIVDVIKGKGTVLDKINALNLSTEMYEFILYILVKILLGRLLYKCVDTKWALTCNYKKLIVALHDSLYSNLIPYMRDHYWMETYLR